MPPSVGILTGWLRRGKGHGRAVTTEWRHDTMTRTCSTPTTQRREGGANVSSPSSRAQHAPYGGTSNRKTSCHCELAKQSPRQSTSEETERGLSTLCPPLRLNASTIVREVASLRTPAKKQAVLAGNVNRLRRRVSAMDRKTGTVHALGDSLGTVPVLLRKIRYIGGFLIHGPAPQRSWLAMTCLGDCS